MSRIQADSDVFRAVADPRRRALLDLLLLGPGQSVDELAARFSVSQPAISQHLRVLRNAGLVTFDKVEREHRYRLSPLPLAALAAWVHPYEQAFAADLRRHQRSRAGERRRGRERRDRRRE